MGNPPVDRVASLDRIEVDPDRLYSAFAVLRNVREGKTRNQDSFLDLELGDLTATVRAKVWADAGESLDVARELPRGSAVKVLFHAELYRDALQLKVHKIRAITDEDDCDPVSLFGEGHELVRDLLCETLVFDIETVPNADRRKLPQTVAESLARHAQRMDSDEEKVMGLSPFFGKVISLAVGDGESEDAPVTVFVVPPDGAVFDDLPDDVRVVTEVELLQAWWSLAAAARTVVSYNGRGFDVPFLVGRSLIHGIPARVDLLSNRYALRPHLDLYRTLTHGERSLGPTNLDVVCWALGIESPKGQMDGSMVAPAYGRGDLAKIAAYNAHDVRATAAVYRAVRDGLLAFREDW